MGSAVPPCPHCKATNVRKIIKAPMVHFKGSGFYKTDSAGGLSVKKEAKATGEVKNSTESKPAEAKPETPKSETQKKSDSPAAPL